MTKKDLIRQKYSLKCIISSKGVQNKLNNNYEINFETIAIIPINKDCSKVIEVNNDLIINKSTLSIIDNSCRFFGSSYFGRFEGTKSLLHISYKNPIIIEESREIIFFPTASPRSLECNWISLDKIDSYKKIDNKTEVYFKNGTKILFDISFASFENQVFRATRLLITLQNKKNLIK